MSTTTQVRAIDTAATPLISEPGLPRVIFVVGGLYTESSGVARIVCDLANALGQLGLAVPVYTAACQGRPVLDHMLYVPSSCVAPPGKWLGRLAWSPQLSRLMEEVMPHVDLVHNQSLWMLPNHYASRAAFQYRKPTVYTAMGFLEPWAIAHSRWKKRLVGAWFQDGDLRRAACIHVNTRREIEGVRAYGLRNPIAVLPNGVNLAAYAQMPSRAVFDITYPRLADKRICLFLSRLHQKKGLTHLVQAWVRVRRFFPEWHLVIAGPDDGYEGTLRRVITDLEVEPSVTLVGPLYGERKLAALAAASLFVLPSFSEGFSMAILEAMAARLPVLITPACNLPEAEQAFAGLQVQPTVDDTARGLHELLQASDAEREQMGRNGRALVEAVYTWDQVARRMIELYRWLAGGGAPPACVERS